MRRQKRCYNDLPTPARWIQGVSEGTGPLRRRRKTLKGLSLLIFLLLMHLVGSPPIRAKPTRRTKITNKVPSAAQNKDENRILVTTHLQRVSTPSKETKKIFPKLSTSSTIRRDITQTSVPKILKGVKKLVSVLATSTSMTSARENALEYVSYIYYPVQFKSTNGAQIQALLDSKREVNAIYPTFVKLLGLPISPRDVGV